MIRTSLGKRRSRPAKFDAAARNTRKGSAVGAGPFKNRSRREDSQSKRAFLYFRHLDENFGSVGVFRKLWNELPRLDLSTEELSNILAYVGQHLTNSESNIKNREEALDFVLENLDIWEEAITYQMAETGFNYKDISSVMSGYEYLERLPSYYFMDSLEFGLVDFIEKGEIPTEEIPALLKDFADLGIIPTEEFLELWEDEVTKYIETADIDEPDLSRNITLALYGMAILAQKPNQPFLNTCIARISELSKSGIYQNTSLCMWSFAVLASTNPEKKEQIENAARMLHKNLSNETSMMNEKEARQFHDASFYFGFPCDVKIEPDLKPGSKMEARVRGIFSRAKLGVDRYDRPLKAIGHKSDFSLRRGNKRIFVEVDGPQKTLQAMDPHTNDYEFGGYNGAAIFQTERLKKAAMVKASLAANAIIMRLPYTACNTLFSATGIDEQRIAETEMALEVMRNVKRTIKAGEHALVVRDDLTVTNFDEMTPQYLQE